MKKSLLLLILNSAFFIYYSSAQTPGWQWAINGGGSQFNEGNDIAFDAYENVYTTGRFSGVCDFDAGPGVYNLSSSGQEDIFICKVDGNGNFIWARGMGSADIDDGKTITLDAAGNVIVTGLYRNTVDFDPGPGVFNLTSNGLTELFVLKLDSAGNFVWAVSIGSTGYDNFVTHAVDVTGSSDIYLTGSFGGVVDFDPGPGVFNLTAAGGNDIYVLKLNSNSQFGWVKQIGSIDAEVAWDLELDLLDSISIYVVGSFIGTVDFDPSASIFSLTGVGLNGNAYVLKLDSAGNFKWVKGFISNGNASSSIRKIDLDSANGSAIYLTGKATGVVDFDPDSVSTFFLTGQGFGGDIFVSKLSNTGSLEWSFLLGSANDNEAANSIEVDFSGRIYLTGYYKGAFDFDPGPGAYSLTSSAGSHDFYVASYDSTGTFIWVKTGVNPNSDYGYEMAISSHGSLIATGTFYNANLILDSLSLPFTLSSGSNYFLAKLTGNGLSTALNGVAVVSESIYMYPNPASNEVTVQSSHSYIQRVDIYDMLGKLQTSDLIPKNIGTQTNTIDVSSLASGIYSVNITSEQSISIQKLIIRK